jgi:acyl-CoA thioester hydrolase
VQFDYLITRADNGEIACTGFTRHCAVNSKNIPVEIDPRTIALWKQFPQ